MRENDEVSNPVIVNCKLKIKFKDAKCLKKNPITPYYLRQKWGVF